MNLFKKNRTVADSYFYGSIFNVLAVTIFMVVGFQYAASQQDHILQIQTQSSQTPITPPPDLYQNFITSGGAIITLILGLGALAGLIIAVFRKVQTNMTKEAKSIIDQYGQQAKTYFDNEKQEQEKARQLQKEAMQNATDNLKTQIAGVNNNVNERFNTTKEKIDEVKIDVKQIKEELTESNKDSTRNAAILGEHERRISVLEGNRFSGVGNITGNFPIK